MLAEAGPGERRVRTLFSGVSRGTESTVFRGGVPESQHALMRCPHQEGHFSGAVKYGYSTVGRVDGSGTLVFCLHPHQTEFVVHQDALVPLPAGLAPGLAVLAPNLETAINGVWDAAPEPGESATVIGGGVVGLLVAWRLKQLGVSVELVETQPARAMVASQLGLQMVAPAGAAGERSLVIHASGSVSGLRHALSLAALEGRIIELSWFGDKQVSLPLGEAFHAKRLTLRSSQVGTISPTAPGVWTHRSRMEMVLELLAKHPELGVLISGESVFEMLPETMAKLADDPTEVLCHRIRYQEQDQCTD
jgi:threonine dehydrogenase-like Zn-dependent dehydrogenase